MLMVTGVNDVKWTSRTIEVESLAPPEAHAEADIQRLHEVPVTRRNVKHVARRKNTIRELRCGKERVPL